MSDTSTSSTTGDEAPDPGELRKRGDKAEAKAAELAAELESVKRELALTNAGVPSSGVGALFRKAYDGELTSEAIVAAMGEYGIDTPEAAPTAAPAPEGAGVVNTIAGGLAADQPVQAPGSAEEHITRLLEMESTAQIEQYLDGIGMLHDPEATGAEMLGRLPDDLKP